MQPGLHGVHPTKCTPREQNASSTNVHSINARERVDNEIQVVLYNATPETRVVDAYCSLDASIASLK